MVRALGICSASRRMRNTIKLASIAAVLKMAAILDVFLGLTIFVI